MEEIVGVAPIIPHCLGLFYVNACFAYVGFGILFPCSAQRGQKMKLDLLEPELEMVVCCHVDAVNQTCVLYKSNLCP